jgi:hypothetical protein
VPVVEINLESCIEDGFGIVVNEKSEIALPILFAELIKLKTKKTVSAVKTIKQTKANRK